MAENKAINTVPQNTILNVTPNNYLVSQPTQLYIETRTINVGTPMGLLLALTYPTTFSYPATRF